MEIANLEETRAGWDAVATGYDEFVTPSGNWALPHEALHHAELEPGMTFLDVASGSGALSLPAARLGARVTAVDLSPTMIQHLERRAREEGLTNVEAHVMDGHALEFEDDTFDVVGSQFGVMLFPDLPRGLREMVRVSRPGGRIVVVAYGPPQEVEFLAWFVAALEAVAPDFSGLPSDPPPLPFQVADPETLAEALETAGLQGIRIHETQERLVFTSGAHMWEWVVNSNPIPHHLVGDLTEEQRERVRQVLDGMLRDASGGGPGGIVRARVHIASGVTRTHS